MTMKMKARELGLDDLRCDVEFTENWGASDTRRVVGQLHKIEGPYLEVPINGRRKVIVRLTVGTSTQLHRHDVNPDSEVTVDRDPQRKSIHHFASEQS